MEVLPLEKRMLTSKQVEQELRSLSSPERAASSKWFFKTGKGQYGYGDKFLGVTVPNQRKVAIKFAELPTNDIKNLLESPLHECRLTALFILVSQYKRADEARKAQISKFYLTNRDRVNNWDLVDSSSSQILGNHLLHRDRKILYKLAKSQILWERRISIISTLAFIANDQFEDSLSISQILLDDSEDLIHKAVGWTLREIGKKSRPTLLEFLDQYAGSMPRTALRYSIEHLPPIQRKHYMNLKKVK